LNSAKINQFANSLGLPGFLEQSGLWPPLLKVKHWLRSHRQYLWGYNHQESARLIGEDYRVASKQIHRLAAGCPQGDRRKVALMVSAAVPLIWGIKLEGMLSLALRLKDYSIGVVDLGFTPWLKRYHEAFGNLNLVDFYKYLSPKPARGRNFLKLTPEVTRIPDLMGLTYRGVDLGRIVLSNAMYRNKFAEFDLANPDIRAEIDYEMLKVQWNVLTAERMLEEVQPSLTLVLEKGLSPCAEIAGASMVKGIPVVQYVSPQLMKGMVVARYNLGNRRNHPYSLAPESWEQVKQMEWGPELEEELLRDLWENYHAGTWFNRRVVLHHDKRIKPAENVRRDLGLDPAKKTAVIFSHISWDATFFYGDSLFDDYETWLVETVRAACANPAVNWIVKIHPDLAWKLKYESYTGKLRDLIALKDQVGELPGNVKLVMPETDISTYSFFEIADYCLTVRGTVGIEMACLGVPVLTAGTGRYSNLGFTVDFNSPAEYLEALAQIQDLPPMNPGQIELARRFAYALFKMRPLHLQSFELLRLPKEQTGHPLDYNLVIRPDSFQEFAAAGDVQELAEWLVSDKADYLKPLT
jgi:hypothetical protein